MNSTIQQFQNDSLSVRIEDGLANLLYIVTAAFYVGGGIALFFSKPMIG